MVSFRIILLTLLVVFSATAKANLETLLQAANQGNVIAQYNLGTLYDFGEEVPQDYTEVNLY